MSIDLIPLVAEEDLHEVRVDAAVILDEALDLRPLGDDDPSGDDWYDRGDQ
jgi:hypothetical protein